MATIKMTGNAGYGMLTYRKNAGIEAKLADLIERVRAEGNNLSTHDMHEFDDGNVTYSVMDSSRASVKEFDIYRSDCRGSQLLTVNCEYLDELIAKLRASA